MSTETTVPTPSKVVFKLGITPEELNGYFNKIGHILTIILNTKLNSTFFNILHRLKPIDDIDNYMLKFNFDKDVAIKQNSDLAIVVEFWLLDCKELRAECETALENVVKSEEFVIILDKQEKDFLSLISKSLESIKCTEKPSVDETPRAEPASALSVQSTDEQKKVESKSQLKSDITLKMKVNDKSEDFTVSRALAVIKERKDRYERHVNATKCLVWCIEGLMAINEINKREISRWEVTEAAIKIRSDHWIGRKTNPKPDKPQTVDQNKPKN